MADNRILVRCCTGCGEWVIATGIAVHAPEYVCQDCQHRVMNWLARQAMEVEKAWRRRER